MTDLEKELRANKLAIIALLAEQMVALNFNEFKDFKIADDKEIPYINATIDLLTKRIKIAKELTAKTITFDKTEAERKNLTPEELKALQEAEKRNSEVVDTFLATLEPRASFKTNIHAPNSIVLRYRGKIGSEFSKNYPFGVQM